MTLRAVQDPQAVEHARLIRDLAAARKVIEDFLRAPYMGTTAAYPMARHNGCVFLKHPPKYPEPIEEKPDYKRGCPCGQRDYV